VIVAPPVLVPDVLYDNARPAGSANDTNPAKAPVPPSVLNHVVDVLSRGVPASHAPGTVIVFAAELTPLEAMIVNVSVLEPVAASR
jgi:hypothetical protein